MARHWSASPIIVPEKFKKIDNDGQIEIIEVNFY